MTLQVSDAPVPLQIDSHGVARVGNTRVTLDNVVVAFQNGATAEEIVQKFPSLDLADVYLVIGYYLYHRDEVAAYMQRRAEKSAEIRQLNESRFPPEGIRERLLARRKNAE